jgi:hypothetical protein
MLVWCAHSISGARQLNLKFDSEYVRRMVAHCADHGIRSLLWRGSYVGKLTYHSQVGEIMGRMDPDKYRHEAKTFKSWDETVASFDAMAEAIAGFDTLDVALAEAKKRGLQFYADIALFDRYFPGLESKFFDDHPQCYVLARDQKTHYRGIPCYAEPATQAYVLREIEELLARGVDGIGLYLESHAGGLGLFGAGGKSPNQFGFNPPVVAAYRQRYSVDILNEHFDAGKLYSLQGELLTGFLRRVRHAVGSKRKLLASTLLDGFAGYGGKGGEQLAERTWIRQEPIDIMPGYRVDLEWEKWMREGIADGLMVYAPMPGAVEQVQKRIRAKIRRGPVYLIRETDNPRFEAEYRKEFAAVAAGSLDGIVIDEMKDYHPHPQRWCPLLRA